MLKIGCGRVVAISMMNYVVVSGNVVERLRDLREGKEESCLAIKLKVGIGWKKRLNKLVVLGKFRKWVSRQKKVIEYQKKIYKKMQVKTNAMRESGVWRKNDSYFGKMWCVVQRGLWHKTTGGWGKEVMVTNMVVRWQEGLSASPVRFDSPTGAPSTTEKNYNHIPITAITTLTSSSSSSSAPHNPIITNTLPSLSSPPHHHHH